MCVSFGLPSQGRIQSGTASIVSRLSSAATSHLPFLCPPCALQEVRIQRKGSKEVESIPCALVVWATGIKPRDFANKVGLPPLHCLYTVGAF